jgi:3-deoxy-D-manno-octulosonate 8-phosphate phosphatase (KDO 8-P phosphatase)
MESSVRNVWRAHVELDAAYKSPHGGQITPCCIADASALCDDEDMDAELKARAEKIKVIVFDVDGVLTDGTLWFIPTGTREDGFINSVEVKGFSAHDGLGMGIGRIAGLRFGAITKRSSDTVAVRLRDLKVEFIHQGSQQKMDAIRQIMQEGNVTLEEICYVGDDIIDLPPMRAVGLAIATWNARDAVKAVSHYVTSHSGGHGAGREAIELVLEAKGVLADAIEDYLREAGGARDIGHNVQ